MSSLKTFKNDCRSLSIMMASVGSLVLGQAITWSEIEPRIPNVTPSSSHQRVFPVGFIFLKSPLPNPMMTGKVDFST